MGMTAKQFRYLCRRNGACFNGLKWLDDSGVGSTEPATKYFDAMLQAIRKDPQDRAFHPSGYMWWTFSVLLAWDIPSSVRSVCSAILDDAGCKCSEYDRFGFHAVPEDVATHIMSGRCPHIFQNGESYEERVIKAYEVLHAALVRAFS